MKKGLVWLGLGAAVVVVLGVIALRADAPTEEEPFELSAPEPEDSELAPGQDVMAEPEFSPAPLPESEPAAEEAGEASGVIEITEAGFSPQTVTIPAGGTVTFINNGQAPHWPASDVHPTHELLPSFDAKRGLATGESYSHVFTEAGTWRCHDHLAPKNVCTIVVE